MASKMIGHEFLPFLMMSEDSGQLKVSWSQVMQGIIVGITSGALSSYVLLARLDERIGNVSVRQAEIMQTIAEIKTDVAVRSAESIDDRRKLAERITAIEAARR